MDLSNNTFSVRKSRALVYEEKISRKEAISRGMNTYVGKRCSCGAYHRYTSGGNCIHCENRGKKEKVRAKFVDMDKTEIRRKIEDIKESSDDYWDSLLED